MTEKIPAEQPNNKPELSTFKVDTLGGIYNSDEVYEKSDKFVTATGATIEKQSLATVEKFTEKIDKFILKFNFCIENKEDFNSLMTIIETNNLIDELEYNLNSVLREMGEILSLFKDSLPPSKIKRDEYQTLIKVYPEYLKIGYKLEGVISKLFRVKNNRAAWQFKNMDSYLNAANSLRLFLDDQGKEIYRVVEYIEHYLK